MDKKQYYAVSIDDEYCGITCLITALDTIRVQLEENLDNEGSCGIRVRRIDMTEAEFNDLEEL